jgi:GAF domain-containing protein
MPADSAPIGERPDEDEDLERALGDLGGLVLGGDVLEVTLGRIATLAASAIAGADGVGLAMLEPDRPETICMSHPFVREVDDIQYSLREGPCITAAAEAATVVSGSLGHDVRWRRFGPRVARLGVHSVLSLPLLLSGEVVGALNVYAHERDAFDDAALVHGETFAVAAAVSVHNARRLMQADRLATQLQAALTNRAVIDQAIGILMSRQGGTAVEAFASLRRTSQSTNVKLAQVAQDLIDEAVRRARARRQQSGTPAAPSSAP